MQINESKRGDRRTEQIQGEEIDVDYTPPAELEPRRGSPSSLPIVLAPPSPLPITPETSQLPFSTLSYLLLASDVAHSWTAT